MSISCEFEAKLYEKYLNDSQVTVFSVGTQVEDVPLHIHRGWKTKRLHESPSYKWQVQKNPKFNKKLFLLTYEPATLSVRVTKRTHFIYLSWFKKLSQTAFDQWTFSLQ